MNEETNADLPPRRVTKRDRSDGAPRRARKVVIDDVAPVEAGAGIDEIERQLSSGVKMSREHRRMLSRRRNALLTAADNPFINERPGVLPIFPTDEDPAHVYHWTRDQLGGDISGDRSNLAEKQNGHLYYEHVMFDDLPPHWQAKASPFRALNGTIRYKDVVFMRADKRMRDMKLAAMEHEADIAADQLNGTLRAQIGAKGNTRARIEEDVEDAEG